MTDYAVPLFFALLFCFLPALPGNAADNPPPGLILANVYDNQTELESYWISEKYDGVRAYWDGYRFVSRQGNYYNAPEWFTRGFPEVPMDGELWMGRGTFEVLSGAVRQHVPDTDLWERIRFMVFDLPAAGGTFDERLTKLKKLASEVDSSYLVPVRQFRVSSRNDLMWQLDQVVEQGGEGLMLHRGSSLYEAARSDDLLKLKTHDDAEAVVIAHLPGRGKYQGKLGAILVETPENLRFRIGTGFSDQERESPPPLGSTITYKYFGKTRNGIPRFASYMRLREP